MLAFLLNVSIVLKMILSIIIGGFFWKNTNPFLSVDKNQKIVNIIQLSLLTTIISFISSVVRISIYNLFSGLIIILIIVNCPLLFLLIWKREEKVIHLIILISSFLIITSFFYWIKLIIDPISQGHPIEEYTIFPPLSYPLMASYEEIIIHPQPAPDSQYIYSYITFTVGIMIPFIGIQLPSEFKSLSSDVIMYQTLVDLILLKNQFFFFIFCSFLNFLATLTFLKIYSKRDMEININRILNSACKMAILLVNILFTSIIITGTLLYYIFRTFGVILFETANIFNFGIVVMISLGLILLFTKYPISQEKFGYKNKSLFFLASFGFIVLVSTWVIDIILPHPEIHITDLLPVIIVDLIIIFMNLVILHKPLTLEQPKTS